MTIEFSLLEQILKEKFSQKALVMVSFTAFRYRPHSNIFPCKVETMDQYQPFVRLREFRNILNRASCNHSRGILTISIMYFALPRVFLFFLQIFFCLLLKSKPFESGSNQAVIQRFRTLSLDFVKYIIIFCYFLNIMYKISASFQRPQNCFDVLFS